MSGNREERKGERERKMQWIVEEAEHNAWIEKKGRAGRLGLGIVHRISMLTL